MSTSEDLLAELMNNKKKARPRLGTVKVDSEKSANTPKGQSSGGNVLKESTKQLKCTLIRI